MSDQYGKSHSANRRSGEAASVAHAIAATANEVRKELLGLAQKTPGSPACGPMMSFCLMA